MSTLKDYGKSALSWGYYETKQFASSLWPVLLSAATTYGVHRLTELSTGGSVTTAIVASALLKWATLYVGDNSKSR